MASGLRMVSDTLTPRLRALPDKVDDAVARTVDFFSPRVETYARSNAPWADRTGNARQGLKSQPEHKSRSRHSIVIAHGVPYGIWLEVRFEGRYGIIPDTVKNQGQDLMNTLRGLFGRVG